jgi:hypothetical protein
MKNSEIIMEKAITKMAKVIEPYINADDIKRTNLVLSMFITLIPITAEAAAKPKLN